MEEELGRILQEMEAYSSSAESRERDFHREGDELLCRALVLLGQERLVEIWRGLERLYT